MYNTLLKILEKRDTFFRYRKYIKEHTIPKEVNTILSSMEEYFNSNPSLQEIGWDGFITWFKLVKVHSLSKEKHEIYDTIFSTIGESVEEDMYNNVIEWFIDKDYAIRMSDVLLKIAEGDDSKHILDVDVMLKQYKEEVDCVHTMDKYIVTSDLDDILANPSRPGLEWRLEELNISVGPLRQEDFVVFAAAPDSGKTTLLAAEASYMCGQLSNDKQVLWFNNEESGKKVKYRIIQSAIGFTKEEIDRNLLKAKEEAEKALGSNDKIVVVNKKDISVHEVEEMLSKYNPGLIVFDQLWKITGFEKESFSEAQHMTRLFGWGRKIAQEYAPVITVHQADGTAQGCQYIEMHQLYMSRVGIQGEADAIITLGRTYDADYANTRWINVAKNKLDGGDRTDPKLRNGKFEVEIDPYRARFIGVYKK